MTSILLKDKVQLYIHICKICTYAKYIGVY